MFKKSKIVFLYDEILMSKRLKKNQSHIVSTGISIPLLDQFKSIEFENAPIFSSVIRLDNLYDSMSIKAKKDVLMTKQYVSQNIMNNN